MSVLSILLLQKNWKAPFLCKEKKMQSLWSGVSHHSHLFANIFHSLLWAVFWVAPSYSAMETTALGIWLTFDRKIELRSKLSKSFKLNHDNRSEVRLLICRYIFVPFLKCLTLLEGIMLCLQHVCPKLEHFMKKNKANLLLWHFFACFIFWLVFLIKLQEWVVHITGAPFLKFESDFKIS